MIWWLVVPFAVFYGVGFWSGYKSGFSDGEAGLKFDIGTVDDRGSTDPIERLKRTTSRALMWAQLVHQMNKENWEWHRKMILRSARGWQFQKDADEEILAEFAKSRQGGRP